MGSRVELIISEIEESIEVKKRLLNCDEIVKEMDSVAEALIAQYEKGKKLLIAGNGGSAADAQHIAGELVSRFYFDRPALSAVALTTDSSILTAIGNDYGYEKLFSRQIEGNGIEGDVFIAISTSGNSQNIVEALKTAKNKNIITVGLSGEKIGAMDEYCDFIIKVPSCSTPRIQEAHILIGHTLCMLIEQKLFGE
ncbi:MAG: D-sedoheptulose 7-phosphate isomerase [Gammaproteobacteria bacterium]|nr:D-sedoheptulose 7-phosphate isomerase [Gammaproteobacteria bacterium]